MKKIKQIMLSLALLVGVSSFALAPTPAQAIDVFPGCNGQTSQVCNAKGDTATDMVKIVINIILSILGIIAVIMIIIGGIRYTTSGGDSAGLRSARDTIIYAVVGLVIAIMAFAIVNFVVRSFV